MPATLTTIRNQIQRIKYMLSGPHCDIIDVIEHVQHELGQMISAENDKKHTYVTLIHSEDPTTADTLIWGAHTDHIAACDRLDAFQDKPPQGFNTDHCGVKLIRLDAASNLVERTRL